MTRPVTERARASATHEVTEAVRQSVRRVLEDMPAYAEASPERRRALAQGLVDLGLVAAGLMQEEHRLQERVARRKKARPMSSALSAGDQMGMQGVRAAPGTLTGMRDAIDFPTYVGSLITGVFQAILTSSTQQIGSLGELVDGVATSAEDFAATVSDGEVAAWLVAKLPRLLTVTQDGVGPKPGVDLSEHVQELTAALGAGEGDPTDPESLMDLGRLKMARDKQSTMATMMQLGLQRIVVDEGRIHASMDLRVDAQSGSQEAKAEKNDWRVNAGASGSIGTGIWGASASASTSIGQVKSDAQYTTEQIGVRAGLRSSVDLAFRTDQVPIDKLASRTARVKLEQAARVPADVSSQSVLPSAPSNFAAPSLDASAVPAAPTAPTPPSLSASQKTPAQTTPSPGGAATPPGGAATPPGGAATPPGGAATPPGGAATPPGGTRTIATPPGTAPAAPPGTTAARQGAPPR